MIDQPAVLELAARALRAAMRDDPDAALAALRPLDGTQGLVTAILGWCDTLAVQKRMRGISGGVFRPAWADPDSGTVITDADAVDPVERWAGQVIVARAAMDNASVEALLRALPRDRHVVGDHIMMVLRMVAETLNEMMRPPSSGATP